MLAWLANLFTSSTISAVGGVAKDIAPYVTVNKDLKESDSHAENMQSATEFQAEFNHAGAHNWFDSIIDGVNRLPRPLLVFGVMWLIWDAVRDPIGFSVIMQALQLVPEWLALVVGQIIGMFMGDRILQGWKGFKGVDPAHVKQVLASIADLKSMKAGAERQAQLEAPAPVIPAKQFEAEMADETKPLSDDAILEWNRRRQSSGSGNGSAPR